MSVSLSKVQKGRSRNSQNNPGTYKGVIFSPHLAKTCHLAKPIHYLTFYPFHPRTQIILCSNDENNILLAFYPDAT
jgi:hypothetical protein